SSISFWSFHRPDSTRVRRKNRVCEAVSVAVSSVLPGAVTLTSFQSWESSNDSRISPYRFSMPLSPQVWLVASNAAVTNLVRPRHVALPSRELKNNPPSVRSTSDRCDNALLFSSVTPWMTDAPASMARSAAGQEIASKIAPTLVPDNSDERVVFTFASARTLNASTAWMVTVLALRGENSHSCGHAST